MTSAESEGRAEAAAWNRHRRPPKLTILNHTLAKWGAIFARDDLARIDNAIRTGLISGLNNVEIAQKVIGSMGLNGVDGVTEITRQNLIRLGRAAIKAANPRKRRKSP